MGTVSGSLFSTAACQRIYLSQPSPYGTCLSPRVCTFDTFPASQFRWGEWRGWGCCYPTFSSTVGSWDLLFPSTPLRSSPVLGLAFRIYHPKPGSVDVGCLVCGFSLLRCREQCCLGVWDTLLSGVHLSRNRVELQTYRGRRILISHPDECSP